MKKIKKIQLLRKLENYHIFTFNEFVRIAGMPKEYARLYLFRLKKDELIFQIERGKYTVFDDPLVFSSQIATPSYISFWTALRFYNLTEQLPIDVMVASFKSRKTLDFQGTMIRFYKIKHLWGYKKERYSKFSLFIAEKEKAIIDSLLLKNVVFDEIIKAVKKKDFDLKKLVNYAIKTKNKSLMKRIGFILESFHLDASKFLKYLDNNYIPLDCGASKDGKAVKKWKIIENRRIHDIN